MKTVLYTLLAVIGLSVFGFIATEVGFQLYARYNPKYEQVRYNTYRESQSFNEGMARDLENLALEYGRSTPEQKLAIRATVQHRFSVVDFNKLPPQAVALYNSIMKD